MKHSKKAWTGHPYLRKAGTGKKKYSTIEIGIGADYGRALMVKAGYSGSGINDVIWMGDVVNSACHLCSKAGRTTYKTILVSDTIYDNMTVDENKAFLNKVVVDGSICYQGNFCDLEMSNWYREHCK